MAKILNVGSINIDYVYSVPHFVQPGETLASTARNVFPGGKGLNQSVALARAGAQVFHAGRTGADGGDVLQVLADAGVNTGYVGTDGIATGHAVIQVNEKGQNCILLYAGANFQLEEAFLENVFSNFGQGDVLVLQNEVNGIPFLMHTAHKRGMRIAFNPSPFTAAVLDYPLELVDWFLLNEIEGADIAKKQAAEDILATLTEMYPKAAIVLTVGKDGVLYRQGATRLSHGIYDVPVVDTTAAGDTFTGFFISSIVAGKPAEEALRLASIASSIAVSRSGAATSIPTLAEVEKANLKPL